ncbi:MAG: L-threonylcarbamoyladenylate synthase [Fimbriiglobus sp.]|nr:L-threonylcarbamoyladenylate synthase [Fimbriiglobus sp.]
MPQPRELPVNPTTPDAAALAPAAEAWRAGGLVAFPTETVYGLGANALDPAAVGRVFAAKGRPATNPLIVHVTDRDEAKALTADWPAAAEKLATAFWPGPLTLVLKKAPHIPDVVTANGSTVAIRVPAHPVARALLMAAGLPIAAPSANRSGELSPTTADHVRTSLGDRVDVIVDGGPCPGGLESTVVDVTGDTVKVLRPGLITVAQLEAVVGPVAVGGTVSGPLPSPGMMAKHYSPRTALEVAESQQEADFLANLYETAGLKVARYAVPADPIAAAARLYADLHALDASGFDRIIAALPPAADEWQAVRDRLTRAAAEE